MAKGRGASIAHVISYIDDKTFQGGLTFMNPMREFLHKEIALYNYMNKVDIIQQKSLAQMMNPTTTSPFFGSADMLIENFFNRLQDKFNVNTVPTVVKLTNKLQKSVNMKGQTPYPFCALCMGVRDEVNNLLEIGSTIKGINPVTGEVHSIKHSDEWLEGAEEHGKVLCYGCKRLIISCYKVENRRALFEMMPQIVIKNAKLALQAESTLF